MYVDSELMFDCLMYLNLYYLPMFTVCEPAMFIAKYSFKKVCQKDVKRDCTVMALIILSEFTKLVAYKVFRERRKGKTISNL